MKEEILYEWNPWWTKEFSSGAIERDIYQKIQPWLKRKEIILLLGARRSGKTTLMYLLIEKIPDNSKVLFIKADDERIKKKNLIDDALESYCKLKNPQKKPFYLFIDEIQEIKDWQKTIKRIYDLQNIKIFLSGSNAHLLREELSSLLTGRFAYFSLLPFSFFEFLKAKSLDFKDILSKKSLVLNYLREYIEFGGFPEIVLEKNKKLKQELLRFYYDSILYRDIARRYNIKAIAKLNRLVVYFLTNISNLANFTKIAKLINLSTDSVVEYLRYLEEAYLIFAVYLFDYSVKVQQINPKKIYCIDNGLRNSLGFRFSKDIERLVENLVFIELKRRGKDIFYWAGKKEVDFAVKEGNKIRELIQVCWNLKSRKNEEIDGLVEALDKFKLKTGMVLTEDFEDTESINGKKIKYVPLWKWLLEQQ